MRASAAAVLVGRPRVSLASHLHLRHDPVPLFVVFGVILKIGIDGGGIVISTVALKLLVISVVNTKRLTENCKASVKLAFKKGAITICAILSLGAIFCSTPEWLWSATITSPR